MLEHGNADEQSHIISVVLKNVYLMSIDQYASKVVEKCVKIASKKELQEFIEVVTAYDGNREYKLLTIVHISSP